MICTDNFCTPADYQVTYEYDHESDSVEILRVTVFRDGKTYDLPIEVLTKEDLVAVTDMARDAYKDHLLDIEEQKLRDYYGEN